MHPELFTVNLPVLGEITITSFGLAMALAFLAGYAVVLVQLRERGEDADLASDILISALIGGIVGAKLYYVLLYWDRTAQDPLAMLFSRDGLVWYGGLAGGVLGVYLMVRRRGLNRRDVGDLAAPAISLAYAIGRLGCLGVGDDYGRPTDSWVGIAFPEGIPPSTAGNLRRFGVEVDPAIPDSQVLAVHPTQIYETLMALGMFIILWLLRKHPHRAGWLFGLWLALAGVERLIVEVFRAKDDRFFGPLTLAQLISLVLIGIGIWGVVKFRRPAAAADAG